MQGPRSAIKGIKLGLAISPRGAWAGYPGDETENKSVEDVVRTGIGGERDLSRNRGVATAELPGTANLADARSIVWCSGPKIKAISIRARLVDGNVQM
jgi:hypothetical protein